MSDRKLTLAISKDCGRNFLDTREASLGELGQYAKQVHFNRFGHARDFRAEFKVTSPVCVDIMGGYVDYEVGDA